MGHLQSSHGAAERRRDATTPDLNGNPLSITSAPLVDFHPDLANYFAFLVVLILYAVPRH